MPELLYPISKVLYSELNGVKDNYSKLHDYLNEITGIITLVDLPSNKECFRIALHSTNIVELIYMPGDNYFGIIEKKFGNAWKSTKIEVDNVAVLSYFFPETLNESINSYN